LTCCWGSLDDGVRVKRIRDELGALQKYKIGFFPHALYESYVADLHRPQVAFGGCAEATVTPGVVRLAPGGRQAVTLKARGEAKTFALSYALTMAATPFTTHSNRYRAYSDGETVLCVPVDPMHHAATVIVAVIVHRQIMSSRRGSPESLSRSLSRSLSTKIGTMIATTMAPQAGLNLPGSGG
jgi:hypothetical protein